MCCPWGGCLVSKERKVRWSPKPGCRRRRRISLFDLGGGLGVGRPIDRLLRCCGKLSDGPRSPSLRRGSSSLRESANGGNLGPKKWGLAQFLGHDRWEGRPHPKECDHELQRPGPGPGR